MVFDPTPFFLFSQGSIIVLFNLKFVNDSKKIEKSFNSEQVTETLSTGIKQKMKDLEVDMDSLDVKMTKIDSVLRTDMERTTKGIPTLPLPKTTSIPSTTPMTTTTTETPTTPPRATTETTAMTTTETSTKQQTTEQLTTTLTSTLATTTTATTTIESTTATTTTTNRATTTTVVDTSTAATTTTTTTDLPSTTSRPTVTSVQTTADATSADTTTQSTTTLAFCDIESNRNIDYHDPDDCTYFYSCFPKPGSEGGYEYIRPRCPDGKMFGLEENRCVPCNRSICDKCEVAITTSVDASTSTVTTASMLDTSESVTTTTTSDTTMPVTEPELTTTISPSPVIDPNPCYTEENPDQRYMDPTNCTRFLSCFELITGGGKSLRLFPCRAHEMFSVGDQDCVPCNPAMCGLCSVAPSVDTTVKSTDVTLSSPRPTVTTTPKMVTTPNYSQSSVAQTTTSNPDRTNSSVVNSDITTAVNGTVDLVTVTNATVTDVQYGDTNESSTTSSTTTPSFDHAAVQCVNQTEGPHREAHPYSCVEFLVCKSGMAYPLYCNSDPQNITFMYNVVEQNCIECDWKVCDECPKSYPGRGNGNG